MKLLFVEFLLIACSMVLTEMYALKVRRLPIVPSKKDKAVLKEENDRGERMMKFIDSSPEPFHVVETCTSILKAQGFMPLDESKVWSDAQAIKAGGKYYYTRNRSSLVAFTVGQNYKSGNGFKIIGAHTDSPNLKVKPVSKRSSSGVTQVNIECYGGGLWHTWFDRDLSIAGRVIVKNGNMYEQRLVKINRSILRVPNLCIHLKTPEERDAFKVNKEDHLIPILCSELEKVINKDEEQKYGGGKEEEEEEEEDQWLSVQEPKLMDIIADELDCDVSNIVDFELSLFDTQNAAISGATGEFLCGSRIDNLASCFVAMEALQTHAANGISTDEDVSMIALFDHEEVGSGSSAGAGSPIMRDAVVRISEALSGNTEGSEVFKVALSKSLIFSVDMAHAIHPNYASKHESRLAPKMNCGVVIKSNANQRYATNGKLTTGWCYLCFHFYPFIYIICLDTCVYVCMCVYMHLV